MHRMSSVVENSTDVHISAEEHRFSFYDKFFDDIFSCRKNITIRSRKCQDDGTLCEKRPFMTGELVDVYSHESGVWKCKIRIVNVSPLHFSELNGGHALQENMSLDELKSVINRIYPGAEEFWLIEFGLLSTA
jgi:uncharacterized protein YqfB (UPF0267 family)